MLQYVCKFNEQTNLGEIIIMSKFIFWFGVVLTTVGILALICFVIQGITVWLRNVDMTNLRQIIEFPIPYVGCVVSYVLAALGIGCMRKADY